MTDRTLAPTLPEAAGGDAPSQDCGRYKVVGTLGAGGMGIVLSAYDPDLERAVALKLLHPEIHGAIGADHATRLTREARAMAQLAHPNVVTIYEVGAIDDRIFLAMELVDGTTLRGWLAERPRSWREVVSMFVEAGRGLAAAHEHGLVHRDFKPDNVLIGSDGRPRVTDFGLAAVAGEALHPRDAASPAYAAVPDDAAPATVTALGTPAYMSPEQWAGGGVDPRSDQFAFCVALWEAVHGERPFAGGQAHVARDAVRRGVLRPPVRRIPRWLDAAIRRGLATDPAARWPDLTSLLDHLAHRTRRRALGVAVIAAAATAVIMFALLPVRGAAPAACDLALDPAWGPVPRVRVLAAFGAMPSGVETAARVGAALDAWGERWRGARTTVCRDGGALAARRHGCLDRRRDHLALLVDELARGSRPTAARALALALELPAPETCLGADGSEALPDPADPRVAQIVRELDTARVASEAQHRPEGRAASERALTAARALGQPALLAEALAFEAAFADDRDRDARKRQLEQALVEATRARDRHLQAEITLRLLEHAIEDRNLPAMEATLPLARAAVTGSEDVALRRNFAALEARALTRQHRPADALAACTRLEDFEPAPHARAQACRCQVYLNAVKLADSRLQCAAALEAVEAVHGKDSAASYEALSSLAIIHSRYGDYEQSRALRERSNRLVERLFGPDSEERALARYLTGTLYQSMSKPEDAKREIEAALAVWTRLHTRPTQWVANAQMLLAEIRGMLGDAVGGANDADRALTAIEAALGPNHPEVVTLLIKHGFSNLAAGRLEVALASFTRGATLAEQSYGASNMVFGLALVSRAQILVMLDRAREALAPAERGLSIVTASQTAPFNQASAHGVLGKARLATGDRAGGRAELIIARDMFRGLAGAEDNLAEAEALLRKSR